MKNKKLLLILADRERIGRTKYQLSVLRTKRRMYLIMPFFRFVGIRRIVPFWRFEQIGANFVFVGYIVIYSYMDRFDYYMCYI